MSPHRAQKRWTQQEKDTAMTMRANGLVTEEIAVELGRTIKSIKSIFYQPRRFEPKPVRYLTTSYDGPAIGRCATYEHLIRNAIQGSAELLRAIELADVRP